MLRAIASAGCAIALSIASAQAQTVFVTNLRGASENPPVVSPATGTAIVLFDPAFQTMVVRTTFAGLTTPVVDAHIHCCAPPTSNAVVAVGFRPAGFPTGVTAGQFSGTFDLTAAATYNPPFVAANGGTAAAARAALVNGTQAGLAYANIHTTRFPGGEIRGQLATGRDLTPEAYGLLPEVVLQTAEFQDSNVRRYLHHVRAGGRVLDRQAATIADGRVGMFLMGSGRTGKFEGRTNRARVDLGSTGAMGGVDLRLGQTALVGVMGGYDASEARLTPLSRQSHVKSWFAGAYGSAAFGPAYVDLHASYGKTDYDLSRRIAVGTFTAESLGDTDSRQWVVAGTAGFRLATAGFEIEPYAGARYVDVDVDGFTETGNIAALTLGSVDLESLQSIVGLRLGADLPAGTVSVRPSLRAEWRHEFEDDDPLLIVGSFGGAGAFGFATTPLGDDHAVVGAGIAVAGGGPLSMLADYTGQFGGGYDIHALTIGFRLAL